MVLAWILGAVLAGSVLSLFLASGVLLFPERVRTHLLPTLVSYAIGTLLGGAFFGLIPHSLDNASPQPIMVAVLGGLLLFFILEKLVIWRHCHVPDCDVHTAVGPLILFGDAIHNLVDGVIIATAFLNSQELGIAATIAIISHEIPQEVGDFGILLDSGYPPRRALALNLLSSLTSMVGGVGAYLLLPLVQPAVPYIMAVSAASFIYIALADLIPGLHRNLPLRDSVMQVVLIVAGIATIAILHH